jgi:membrane protease YdiL (CAAX protease family)
MDQLSNPLPDPAPSHPPTLDTRARLHSRVFYGRYELRAGWRLLIFFAILSVLFSIAAMFLRLLGHPRTPSNALDPQITLFAEGLPLLLVLIGTWAMAKLEGRSFAGYGLPGRGAFRARFWLGAVVGFAAISALLGAMRLAGVFHLAGTALHGAQSWKYAALWGAVFLIVGLFEEFFFRGYVLFTLTTGITFWPAAILMSLLFGYVHHSNSGETWVGAFAAGLVGFLFCLLLRRTGDLWMPIGFHASWDWGETYFYGVPDSGQLATGHLFNATFSGPQWLTGGTVGPEGSYLVIVLLVLLLIIFALVFRQARYPDPDALRPSRHAFPPITPANPVMPDP